MRGLAPDPLPTVAAFVQLGYPELWPELLTCVTSVATSPYVAAVDVYVSTYQPGLQAVQARVAQLPSELPKVRAASFLEDENRGADWGLFLRQIQSMPANHTPDFFLKMHSKGDHAVRRTGIDSLCATSWQVDVVMSRFAAAPALGMLGPSDLTANRQNPSLFDLIFVPKEVERMQEEWAAMAEPRPFPDLEGLTVIMASMFWMRGSALFGDEVFMKAVPGLVDRMAPGYQTGSCCQTAHALERLVAVRAQMRGFEVAPQDGLRVLRRPSDDIKRVLPSSDVVKRRHSRNWWSPPAPAQSEKEP